MILQFQPDESKLSGHFAKEPIINEGCKNIRLDLIRFSGLIKFYKK